MQLHHFEEDGGLGGADGARAQEGVSEDASLFLSVWVCVLVCYVPAVSFLLSTSKCKTIFRSQACTLELHRLGLAQARVLVVPAGALEEEALDVRAVLGAAA